MCKGDTASRMQRLLLERSEMNAILRSRIPIKAEAPAPKPKESTSSS